MPSTIALCDAYFCGTLLIDVELIGTRQNISTQSSISSKPVPSVVEKGGWLGFELAASCRKILQKLYKNDER